MAISVRGTALSSHGTNGQILTQRRSIDLQRLRITQEYETRRAEIKLIAMGFDLRISVHVCRILIRNAL